MNAVCLPSWDIPRTFSSCSSSSYDKYLSSRQPGCLMDKPAYLSLETPAVCGNGFLEQGEQCDCGSLKVRQLSASQSVCPLLAKHIHSNLKPILNVLLEMRLDLLGTLLVFTTGANRRAGVAACGRCYPAELPPAAGSEDLLL